MGRGYDGGLSTVAGDEKRVQDDRDGWMSQESDRLESGCCPA